MEPTTPTPTPLPAPSKPLWRTSRGILIAAGAIVVATIGGWFIWKTLSTKPVAVTPPTPPIMIGDFRYVSACQALPLSAVEKIYGKLSATARFSEQGFTGSYSTKEVTDLEFIEASCTYETQNADNAALELAIDQYPSAAAAQAAWHEFASEADRFAVESLDRLDKDTTVSGQNAADVKDARALHNAIKDSSSKLQSSKTSNSGTFDGMITYLPTTARYIMLHANAVIIVGYGSDKYMPSDSSLYYGENLPSTAYVSQVAQAKRMLDVLLKNVASTTLNQQMSNPIISDGKTLNNMTLVDPCKVLTPSVYASAIGNKPSRKVLTSSYYRNIDAVRIVKGFNRNNSATCTYTEEQAVGDKTKADVVAFRITYHKNMDDAQYIFKDADRQEAAGSIAGTLHKPTTHADQSMIVTFTKSQTQPVGYARYKTAVIDMLVSTGLDKDPKHTTADDVFIKLINQTHDAFKADQPK